MAETITLRAYLDELKRMLEQEAPAEVISHCRHILRRFPQNIDTYRLLAKALLEKGHHENLEEHFAEAEEVFRRVLGAVPHDYVAHLGLSEVYNRSEELDQAIWHLERAYEQMPGNAMLQDALRELYIRRDGEEHAPARIQLTRGALARQYMNGQLYDQAAAELRAALAQHPDRVDLQVLLAETLWSGWHEVEAGEAAVRVLKTLPNCLAANRILAQLWLDNERPTDARPFLDRVEALDPYAAAEILQPGVESFDHVELERLDYYAQSQAELSAQTPGWVHDLEAVAGTGNLWSVSPEGAGHDEAGPAFDPAHLDMAALFGEGLADEQGDDTALPSWPADWPPEPDVEWDQAASARDEVPSEMVSADEMPPEIEGAVESGEAAIEADWLSVTDELRAAAADDDGQILQGVGAPGQDAPADLSAGDDLLASLDIFDAEWGVADEVAARSLAAESVAHPGSLPVSEDDLLAAETDAGIAMPATQDHALDTDTPLSEAAFIDRLAEPPDFGLPGTGDMDWPGVLEGVGDEAPQEAGGEPFPAEQLADGESALVTDDELRFLDESIPTDTGWEGAGSESDRDDFDRALQDLFSASELAQESTLVEGVTAPEWLPSWVVDLAADAEADLSAGSSEALQLDEWLVGEEASLPGETLPGEGAVRPEGLADEPGSESPLDVEEPMVWMADVADAGEVVDAELLEALAAAGQSEIGPEPDGPTGAQPAVELPDWILEAAPLSGRAPDSEPDWVAAEELETMAAETAAGGAEVESGEPAGWDASEVGQAFDWIGAGDLTEEGVAGVETGDRDWLDSLVQLQAEPQSEWYGADGVRDTFQEWQDERDVLDASPTTGDEAVDSWDQAKAEEGVEETMPDQPALESWVELAGELEGSSSELQPTESALDEQWSVGAAEIADGETPAWLEGMLGEDEEGIAGELAVEDLAALLDEQYDPYEGRGPDVVPHYGSARETGILQPDERPDWMAAFTGEEVPSELDERVDALLSGESDTGDRTAPDSAAPDKVVADIEDLVPAMDSGYDEGEPALAYDTEFPYGFDVSAEEGDIPSWLLAIADSEADKLDELLAGEAASGVTPTGPEVAPSEEEDAEWSAPGVWSGQDAFAEDAQGYAPQEAHDADSAVPFGGEEFASGIELAEEEASSAAEVPSPGEATPLAELAEGEWDAQFDGVSSALWAEEEGLDSEPEPDWPGAAIVAEASAELAGGLPDDFDDEPVPDDFSFGDWLPIWLREPLESERGRSLGLRPDEASEPPEWLRDVSEDGQ